MKETPKRSNEPVVWLLFGAGTTVSAIVFPILIFILGLLLPFGLIENGADNIIAFAGSWLGKLILLVVLVFPTWGQCIEFTMAHMILNFIFQQVGLFSTDYQYFTLF